MIIFEIIGQTSHMIPILIGVLMSYAVSSSLCVSAFDALIEIKNLPFLSSNTGYSTYHLTAKDLMNRNFLYLTQDQSKLGDIAVIIAKVAHSSYTVPVVESDAKKTLLFTVQSQQLRKLLIRKFIKVQSKLDPEVQTLLKQYFEALNKLRLGEDMHEAREQEVPVGVHGLTEVLEPFVAFVHHKEFQIAQLLTVLQSSKSEGARKDESNIGEDAENFFTPVKLYRQQ